MLLAAQPFLAHKAAIHTVSNLIGAHMFRRDNVGHQLLQDEEMAQIFVKALSKITRFLQKHAKPFIAKIANRRGLGAIRLE